jgi:hypothetical protein
LANQLVEAGHVISDTMARQEIRHLEAARVIAYTRGLGDAVQAGDMDHVTALAKPAAGGLNVESLMVFDAEGRESLHLIKQSNGTITDVSKSGGTATLPIVQKILAENNPDSLPKREIAQLHQRLSKKYWPRTTRAAFRSANWRLTLWMDGITTSPVFRLWPGIKLSARLWSAHLLIPCSRI